MIHTQKSIWNKLKERRKNWIGHLINNTAWITTIIQWRIDEKTGRRRPRTPFMEQVIEDTGTNTYAELKRQG